MKLNLAQWLLVVAGVTALGCAKHTGGAQVAAQYTRYGAQMSQGGYVLPPLPDSVLTNFPAVVRLDKANGFEVESSMGLTRGRVRLERDSIFLDEVSKDTTRLAIAGRLFGDTLHLHWIPDYGVDPEHDAEWQLFFVKAQ
jgi:hypothetical protein